MKDQLFLPLHSALRNVCSILTLGTILVTKYLPAVTRITSFPVWNQQEKKLLQPKVPVNILVSLAWSASCALLCHVTRGRRCADCLRPTNRNLWFRLGGIRVGKEEWMLEKPRWSRQGLWRVNQPLPGVEHTSQVTKSIWIWSPFH